MSDAFVTPGIQVNEIALASRAARLAASLIDGVILMGIMLPIMLASGAVHQAMRGDELSLSQHVGLGVTGCLAYLAVNGYLLSKRGQTIGKAALGMRIVDMSGQTPDLGRLFVLRHVAMGLLTQIPVLGGLIAVGNALCIFGPERRCLHDYLAGTRVINA